MHDAHEFLRSLALVLCVAAVTTVLFQRLRQPVVFGYLIAGLIIGPHVPVPLVANREIVVMLSELGVIFLMFSLGLELNLRQLARVAPTAGTIALLETSVMMWLGFTVSRLLGWSFLDSVFAGAAVAISSTTIIVKVFEEHRVRGPFTETVFGILIVEDLIAILLLTLSTAVASGGGLTGRDLMAALGRLAGFMVALLVIGMMVVPRLVRSVVKLDRSETTLVVCLGLCAGAAYLAQRFGYSVALGAFLAGALVAESGVSKPIVRLVEPVRDMFVAIFFVSVGMLIDPALVMKHWAAILLFTAIVIAGKVTAVTLSTFLTGSGTRSAVQTGMSLAQIGEFSFIIATIGLATGATSSFLYPITVAVSAITALTTPGLVRAADGVAAFLDRSLPRRIQTFVALYGSWMESMRSHAQTSAQRAALHRTLRTLAIDAAVIAGLCIGAALEGGSLGDWLAGRFGISPRQGRAAVVGVAVLLSLPFVIGIVRNSRGLARALTVRAFPDPASSRLDPAAAPRRAMIVTLQLATVLIVCAPIFAVTQPFVPAPLGFALMAALLIGVGVTWWRTAADFQGHVKAAAEVIVAALGKQSRSTDPGADPLSRARDLLPGLGEPVPVEIMSGHPAVGRSLAALALRGRTGATVVAIVRGEDVVLVPDGHEVLRAGDVLAIAGTRPAIGAAREVLGGSREVASSAIAERS